MTAKKKESWLFESVMSFVAGAALILLLGAALMAADWLARNGTSWGGLCVNHFGETYRCSIAGWMLRMFSPFSCIPYALILYTVLAGAVIMAKLLIKRTAPEK